MAPAAAAWRAPLPFTAPMAPTLMPTTAPPLRFRLPRMRLSIFSFSLLLVAACGGEKNTSETDGSTGGTGTGGATSSTGGTTGDEGTSDAPTTTGGTTDVTVTGGESDTTAAPTNTSKVTGESESGESGHASHGESGATGTGETGGDTDTTGGVDPVGTAIVENSCAPDDGPALEFKLEIEAPVCGAQPVGEKLRLLLWQGGPLPAGVYPVGEQTGFATYQVGNNEPVNSVAGTLTIESWVGDVVVGSYDLTFVDDSARQGAFTGPFCMVNAPCG